MQNAMEKEAMELPVNDNTKVNSPKKVSNRAKKRKREQSDSSDNEDTLPDNTLEVEKSLQASALKNNLDDASVKKILKKVVTNDHVLALVKIREEEERQAEMSEAAEKPKPKLTRAKVKELMKGSSKSAPWNLENMELTPIKQIPVKTRPEVKALIAQELPEDEDDDEYEPTHDDVSEDEQTESCSDLDSQPRTPATPKSVPPSSPQVTTDGPFKVPRDIMTPTRRRLDLEKEATIALRTRSKLSLSSTTIEHIESTFVPPDEVPWPDVDEVWSEFLTECLNPASNSRHEDDDEADPEYNVLADPDAADEDEEALENSIIKISKKELNDLVTELFHIMPAEMSHQDYGSIDLSTTVNSTISISGCWEGKREPMSDEEVTLQDSNASVSVNASQFSIGKDMSTNVTERSISIGKDMSTPIPDSIGKDITTNILENSVSIGPTAPVITASQNDANSSMEQEPVLTELTNVVPRSIIKNDAEQSATLLTTLKNASGSNQVVKERDKTPQKSGRESSIPIVVSMNVNNGEADITEKNIPEAIKKTLKDAVVTQTIDIEASEDGQPQILPGQVQILQQQLRQHIQLATSNYLQLYVHPTFWNMAAPYKEYVKTFLDLVDTEKDSVANVCNLRPAYDLMLSWEDSATNNTEQCHDMIRHVQKEIEISRKRIGHNAYYETNFHDTYKQVVANSSVFLYPCLLPPMPYRADKTKKFSYIDSEDELFMLCLEQFWQHIERNKEIYSHGRRRHSRSRWGYSVALELMVTVNFPWNTPRNIIAHINHQKRMGNPDSPIVKYFKSHRLTPVKHKILPYNPQLTLYEHPEHEMPLTWLKYIAQNSGRAKRFIGKTNTGFMLSGVDVVLGQGIQVQPKEPLPADFTKDIALRRSEHDPEVMLRINDKPDENTLNNDNLYTVVETSTGAFLVPLGIVHKNTKSKVSKNIIDDALNSALGSDGVILGNDLPEESGSIGSKDKSLSKIVSVTSLRSLTEHCTCCLLYKRIVKTRQTTIKDFFVSNSKVERKCPCQRIEFPKITNRLKILVGNFGSNYEKVYVRLNNILSELVSNEHDNNVEEESNDYNINDTSFALRYQMKLMMRITISSNYYLRTRIHNLFSSFKVNVSDNPLWLARELRKCFEKRMIDLYKEFMPFLTAEQADTLGMFKDYFVQTELNGFVGKVEEQVQNKSHKLRILSVLNETLTFNYTSSCELCTKLLECLSEYPALATYLFGLFPHKLKGKRKERESSPPPSECGSHKSEEEKEQKFHVTIDYEADHSSSGEDGSTDLEEVDKITKSKCQKDKPNSRQPDMPFTNSPIKYSPKRSLEKASDTKDQSPVQELPPSSSKRKPSPNTKKSPKIKICPKRKVRRKIASRMVTRSAVKDNVNQTINDDNTSLLVERKIQNDDSSSHSMHIMSDEEIKTEPTEWKKEEDKTILEVLKQCIGLNTKPLLKVFEEATTILSDTLSHRNMGEVEERVSYLLDLLITSHN